MRRLRRGSSHVGSARLLAALGLFGIALALAGCATSPANATYASLARVQAANGPLDGNRQAEPAAPRDAGPYEPSQPLSLSSIPAFLRGLLGPFPRTSSAEEEALIERAIAEHEMRKP